MYIKMITPPVSEPLTLQEVKDHLRAGDGEDDYLLSLIKEARDYAQTFTNRQLMPATFEAVLTYADFQKGKFQIPTSPFLAIQTFKYFDSLEVETDYLAADYVLHDYQEPVTIEVTKHISESTKLYPVRITFTAGYDELPGTIRRGMLYLIGKWYSYREDSYKKNPTEADYLFWPERVVPC